MTEISNLNNRSIQSPFINQQPAGAAQLPEAMSGLFGQPIDLQPAPIEINHRQILTAALMGREASQKLAAERMRESGGTSATERLLNLNIQPSFVGAFPPPPGNREALRHLSPAMRRSLMTALLAKQRGRLRHFSRLLRDNQREQSDSEHREQRQSLAEPLAHAAKQRDGAQRELTSLARLLDLLEELLKMQEYTLSQMSSFAQG